MIILSIKKVPTYLSLILNQNIFWWDHLAPTEIKQNMNLIFPSIRVMLHVHVVLIFFLYFRRHIHYMIWEIYTKWNALFLGNFSAAKQDKQQVHNKVKDKE